ncbi:MAG: hypothetical protein V1794_00035 [Candidatus Glassbacteria bacterium]
MADQDKKKDRRGGKTPAQDSSPELTRAFTQKNLLLFVVALAVIVLGHISLGMGSITFAPVCLVLGYCILVPLAIII